MSGYECLCSRVIFPDASFWKGLRTSVLLPVCALCQHIHFAVLERASFSQAKTEWPWRGGANGSVRFYPEIGHAANAGMSISKQNYLAILMRIIRANLCLSRDIIGNDQFNAWSGPCKAKIWHVYGEYISFWL